MESTRTLLPVLPILCILRKSCQHLCAHHGGQYDRNKMWYIDLKILPKFYFLVMVLGWTPYGEFQTDPKHKRGPQPVSSLTLRVSGKDGSAQSGRFRSIDVTYFT